MFLFFCAICFAAEPTINWMNELKRIIENLGVTTQQARQITHGVSYDFRKLPVFEAAFSQALGTQSITSDQAEEFIDRAEFLLVAYVRNDKEFIPTQDIAANHPLATFYIELKNRVLSEISTS